MLRNEKLKSNEEKLKYNNQELLEINEKLSLQDAELHTQNIILGKTNIAFKAKEAELNARNILLKQTNETLKTKENELIRVNNSKDKFFSILGHDLKNMVHSVILTSDVLISNFTKIDASLILTHLKRINQASQDLSFVLEDILQWGISQQGGLTLNFEQINMNELVRQSIRTVRNMSENKKIDIDNFVEIGTIAYIDTDTIRTVLRNLLTNAIKYTKENGNIIISVEDKGDEFIQINVIDTGVGMSPDIVSMILIPDSYYSEKGTKNESGTGLGMNLVQDFIRKNGGVLTVKSQVGIGSAFCFTLKKSKYKVGSDDMTEIKRLFSFNESVN